MEIINVIEKEVKEAIQEYKNNASDHYDFWEEHIKYVYMEAIDLANKNNADTEIVALGALLHDMALIKKVGTRADHHINGEILARDILTKYNYPQEKQDRVLKCVLNHRSSKNATSIEEMCVADADILAHFDNIPMLINSAKRNNIPEDKVNDYLKEVFEKDYNDLSDMTKESFKERYESICEEVLENKRNNLTFN